MEDPKDEEDVTEPSVSPPPERDDERHHPSRKSRNQSSADSERRRDRSPASFWKSTVGMCAGAGAVLGVIITIFTAGQAYNDINRSIGENKREVDALKTKVGDILNEETGCRAKANEYTDGLRGDVSANSNMNIHALIAINSAMTQLHNEIRIINHDQELISDMVRGLASGSSNGGHVPVEGRPPSKEEVRRLAGVASDSTSKALNEAFRATTAMIKNERSLPPIETEF